MATEWTRGMLSIAIAAPPCAGLIWLWTKVDAGFVASFGFFAFLICVVAPIAGRIATAVVRN